MIGYAQRPRSRGFTLLEIMIVVLVITTLLLIAVPNFLRAREASRSKACTKTLIEIESAKEQWAMSTKAAPTESPNASDLITDYIKGSPGVLPACPNGGTYSINSVQQVPTCSIGTNGTAEDSDDHVLNPR